MVGTLFVNVVGSGSSWYIALSNQLSARLFVTLVLKIKTKIKGDDNNCFYVINVKKC